MAGDRIDIFGKSYYFTNNTGGTGANSAIPVLDILTGLLGGPTGGTAASAHGGVNASQLNGISNVTSGITTLLGNQTTDAAGAPTVPKAYINYIFFDEQFKVVSSGFSKVGSNSVVKTHTDLTNKTATKNGYVYIYVSNESPVNVFFDNLQVIHTRGAILEETHYYPFGLTMAGISSKALNNAVENKYRFNSGNELQNKEFSDGSGLEWYDAIFRGYDPQVGRFIQVDPFAEASENWTPYAFVQNNPILYNDPYGLDTVRGKIPENYTPQPGDIWVPGTGSTPQIYDPEQGWSSQVELQNVTVTGKKTSTTNQSDQGYKWYQFFNDHNPGGDFLYEVNRWNPLANLVNGIKTYATGSDTYGVQQTNVQATIQIASVLPIGRISSTVSNVSLAAVRQGIAKTLANPNSLSHILASKHNLNLLLTKAGSEANIIRRLYLSLGQSGTLPANGTFETTVAIYGNNVTIRGAVVDGIPRIGTAFIP